jgi:GNAT superfamily N-acetyltransferase
MEENIFSLSPMDKERFGVEIGKVFITKPDMVESVLEDAAAKQAKMIIARCKAENMTAAQELEKRGFFLTDTLVYYTYRLQPKPRALETPGYIIRSCSIDEASQIKDVSTKAFAGYFGHYHADQRLDKTKCDEVYQDWAYRSCAYKTDRDDVLVAEENGKLIAFATMRLNTDSEGEGVLFGVDPDHQGKGIYKQLILAGIDWCQKRGCQQMIVSTQISNIAVQKVWVRVGFEPSYGYFTFHKWL